MKRLIFVVWLCAVPALAQGEVSEPPRPPPEEPASSSQNGLLLELDVLGVNSFGNILSLSTSSTATGGAAVVNPSAAVGFLFGKNAVMVNLGLLGYGPGTNVAFSINPLFRHYFASFQTGSVNLFVEGGLSFGFLSPASGNSNYLIGLFGGGGAEWLFVKNIGLIVDVLAEYGHAHFSGGGTFGGGDTNADVIGFAGNVGVTVHF